MAQSHEEFTSVLAVASRQRGADVVLQHVADPFRPMVLAG
jgi:hypothetical protein